MFRRSHPQTHAGELLAELYREHATATYRFAYHLCGSRADAEDLVQIAFLEAHRALLRGEVLVTPGAWLARVVRTRASNLRRDRHEIPASGSIDERPARSGDLGDAEELRRVRLALWALPETQHEAFVLRYWSGLANSEIAEALDTTESAVESLLVRARRSLLGAGDLGAECVAFRTRLADGLPETPAMQRHRSSCAGCQTAGLRLAGAAGIATVFGLAPHVGVAHALAAAVPGFTAVSATSAGAGLGSAAAAKALISKAAIAAVAVGTTAAAIHTGVLPALNPLHHHAPSHLAAPSLTAQHAAQRPASGPARLASLPAGQHVNDGVLPRHPDHQTAPQSAPPKTDSSGETTQSGSDGTGQDHGGGQGSGDGTPSSTDGGTQSGDQTTTGTSGPDSGGSDSGQSGGPSGSTQDQTSGGQDGGGTSSSSDQGSTS